MHLFAFLGMYRDEIRVVLLTILLLYLSAVVGIVWAVVKCFSTRRSKIIAGLVAWLLVFGFPVGWFKIGFAIQDMRYKRELEVIRAEEAAADARMAELCKSSGEFIHRRAENVEGVFLMKLRPPTEYPDDRWKNERAAATSDREREKWKEDPFGYYFDGQYIREGIAEGYLEAFLNPLLQKPPYFYYSYVDLIDPNDGKRYRYTGYIIPAVKGQSSEKFALHRREVTPDMPLPRYGVIFNDITDRADRERWWIAGSSLRVIDLQTSEVMGERVGYMIASRQYSSSLGESYTWRYGRDGCPYESMSGPSRIHQTEDFIRKVIQPKNWRKEDAKP